MGITVRRNRIGRWTLTEVAFFLFCLALPLIGIRKLPLAGEEPRRAEVAREMLLTADWLVPREQGVIYCTRPPLQNWAIAVMSWLRGSLDPLAVRLPSALATGATALVCFWFARSLIDEPAGVIAGAVFLTMGTSLTIGQLGETDPLFACFVGASLLTWYWGLANERHRTLGWAIAGGLAGLGALTKGLQAPLYFLLCTAGYLVLLRRFALLRSRGYWLGLMMLLLPISLWSIPYFWRAGGTATLRIWFEQVGQRITIEGMVLHLLRHPLETVGAMLPWSVMFFSFLDRRLWQGLGRVRGVASYLIFCLAITFPSVWFVPDARHRYFLPLYPVAAVLIAIPLAWFPAENQGPCRQRRYARLFLRAAQLVAIVAAVMVLALQVLVRAPGNEDLGWLDPGPLAGGVVVLTAGLVVLAAQRALATATPEGIAAAVLAFACFLGLGHRFAILNIQSHLAFSPEEEILQLARELPSPETLVSVGPVPARFRYFYPFFIRRLEGDPDPEALEGATAFCLAGELFRLPARPSLPSGTTRLACLPFEGQTLVVPRLRFPWRIVKVIPIGRTRTRNPQPVVVVGTRASEGDPSGTSAEAGSKAEPPGGVSLPPGRLHDDG